MKNKIISLILMGVCSFFIVAVSGCSTIPPRELTFGHLIQLAFIPLGVFIAARPGIPVRWFTYMALLVSGPFLGSHAYHIKGTACHWGVGEEIGGYILALAIVVAIALCSTLTAAWRQRLYQVVGPWNTDSETFNKAFLRSPLLWTGFACQLVGIAVCLPLVNSNIFSALAFANGTDDFLPLFDFIMWTLGTTMPAGVVLYAVAFWRTTRKLSPPSDVHDNRIKSAS